MQYARIVLSVQTVVLDNWLATCYKKRIRIEVRRQLQSEVEAIAVAMAIVIIDVQHSTFCWRLLNVWRLNKIVTEDIHSNQTKWATRTHQEMRYRKWTFLRQHCTRTGQRLRPLNGCLISTKHLRYLPIKVLTWTRPSKRLRSTMDVPIATRKSSGDMGVGKYNLKSRLLPRDVLPKKSLNRPNRAYHISMIIDYQM